MHLLFVFLFIWGLVLKQGLPYVVLVGLQLTVDKAGSLCLPSAKIKAMHHHNWLHVFSVVSYYSVLFIVRIRRINSREVCTLDAI